MKIKKKTCPVCFGSGRFDIGTFDALGNRKSKIIKCTECKGKGRIWTEKK